MDMDGQYAIILMI